MHGAKPIAPLEYRFPPKPGDETDTLPTVAGDAALKVGPQILSISPKQVIDVECTLVPTYWELPDQSTSDHPQFEERTYYGVTVVFDSETQHRLQIVRDEACQSHGGLVVVVNGMLYSQSAPTWCASRGEEIRQFVMFSDEEKARAYAARFSAKDVVFEPAPKAGRARREGP